MLKAIETQYRGYKFRSRLEARYAVFFDALGMQWEYEKEGFDLGKKGWYLPDFWITKPGTPGHDGPMSVWAEVKPISFTQEEVQKCLALALGTETPIILLEGVPATQPYWYIAPEKSKRGELKPIGGQVLLHSPTNTFCWQPIQQDVSDLSRNTKYQAAVITARSARFEHGQRG